MTQQQEVNAVNEASSQAQELLTRCPLCSGELGWYDRDYRGVQIYRCSSCGTALANPQPTDTELEQQYSSYNMLFAPEDQGAQVMSKQRARRHKRKQEEHPSELRYDYNFSLIEKFTTKGKFLSIGCGWGYDLQFAKSRGWAAEGLELCEDVALRTQERSGCPVHHGDYAGLDLEADSYQCVYMSHVLEHPRQPDDFLRKSYEILSPGGVLWIACPNIASISNRWKRMLGKLGLKKRRGNHYASWHHLFFFNPAQLGELLEKQYGFEVKRTQGEWMPNVKGKEPLRERVNQAIPDLKSCFQLIARKPG
jgi:2-polyprenyl-3-methyl-5-hydroxy-6-metoxy-1,4-benzoquinol methylase